MSFLQGLGRSLANVASSSSVKLPAQNTLRGFLSPFSTSAVNHARESRKKRVSRLNKKLNVDRREQRAKEARENRPHVVLGTRPGDEAKWQNCDLAKVLVKPEELNANLTETVEGSLGPVAVPQLLSFGLNDSDGAGTRKEKIELFFKNLPDVTVDFAIDGEVIERISRTGGNLNNLYDDDVMLIEQARKLELQTAHQFARVVDLRNANARGISFENRRRIITAFSPTGSPSDSGYPEVQVALLTMKIRNIWDHMMKNKKDINSRRSVRLLVHQRAKLLKYIRKTDRDRYDRILERVAVEPEAIEGELVI